MESYKLYRNKKDNDDKNIDLKLNGINKKLIKNTDKAIENSKLNKTGIYGVWLNFIGEWKLIVIDDSFPIFTKN